VLPLERLVTRLLLSPCRLGDGRELILEQRGAADSLWLASASALAMRYSMGVFALVAFAAFESEKGADGSGTEGRWA
jgi:hypothetical protein